MEERSKLDFNGVFNTLQQNLLDMGLRNNLLNFKEVARTIPIVDVDLMDIFDSLVLNKNKLSFLPKKSSKESDDELWSIPVESEEEKDELQLQTTLTEKELQKRLFSLYQYYRTSIQDLGYNNLFMALGFVEWKQVKDNSTHKAPLVLVPIELSRRSVGSPFKVEWTREDISLNLSLKHKLQDQGIIIPEQNSIESKNDLMEYIGKVKRAIEFKDGWKVNSQIYISTFSFKKFVMFKDLTMDNWTDIENSEIGRLFGLSEVDNFDSFETDSIDENLDPKETYNVVDADSSQIAVIEDAKKGHSLVVEGPPGTGKSQTIVNLISELLANEKKILFVSEKMAALEVVKKRMDSVGLGSYCLELHSNKTRKRAFLEDLNKSLLQDKISVDDYEDYEKLQQSTDNLNQYGHVIRSKYGDTNLSIYDLIGLYEYKYQEMEKVGQRVYKFNLPNLNKFTPQKRTEIVSNIDQIAEIYKLIRPIKDNPWHYTNIDYISPDDIDNINFKSSEIDSHMEHIQQEIDLFSQKTNLKKPTKYGEIKKYVQQAKLTLSDQDYSTEEEKLKKIVSTIQEYQNNYDTSLDVTKIEIEPIKERFDELALQIKLIEISYDIMFHQEVRTLLSNLKESNKMLQESPVKRALNDPEIVQKFYQFRANKDSFTKFMNKDYKKAKNELKSYYSQDVDDNTITEDFDNLLQWNDDVNAIKNKILPYSKSGNLSVEKIIYELEKLISIFDEISEINSKIAKVFKKEIFKTLDDLEYHINSLYKQKELKKFIDDNDSTAKKYFKSWNNVNTDFSTLATEYEGISKFVKNGDTNRVILDDFTKKELKQTIYDLETHSKEIEEDYKYLNSILHFKDKLNQNNINSIRIDEYNDLIQNISENIRSLSNWSQFNNYCSQYNNSYTKEIIKLIKDDKIKAEAIVPLFEFNFANNILKEVFADNELLKNFNSNIYDKNIELFKELDLDTINLNRYRVREILDSKRPDLTLSIAPTSQLGILVHEMNKKRNHKSIRQVLNECPDTITDIKPCLLMSPLSIAQYLDSKTFESYFDYIIFDEASQVRIEDAIGALLRGKHYIIMGDTKQLPPTVFFDVETNVDSQEAEDMHVQDVESILHFCKSVLPYRMLKCHYRSRHESLIAVSNYEFYNNDLFIYPSPIMHSKDLGLKLVYNPENIYDKGKTRQNKGEAKQVVEYALAHYGKYGFRKSLGIGTFSVAQKQAILEELELRLKENPELETYFNTTGEKSFFVKNIENIQGDERDVMLISIGYGFDNQHKLSNSFGPLNNDGGERRLNVLTTRAKEKCVVFSNFKSADMQVTGRTPKGVQVLKTYLYYAEHGQFPSEYLEDEKFDSKFEEAVYNYLIKKGYKVEKRVGCAGYRIDLAVIDPNNSDEYILGIECDGSSYNDKSSARERDRIRQTILEGLGWHFIRIWSTDWYHNRQNAKQNLIQAINNALKEKQEIKTLDEVNMDTVEVKPKDKAKVTTQQSSININENMTPQTEQELSDDEVIIPEVEETGENKVVDEFDEIFEALDEEDSDNVIIRDIKDIRTGELDDSQDILEDTETSNEYIEEEDSDEFDTETSSETIEYDFVEEPSDDFNSYEEDYDTFEDNSNEKVDVEDFNNSNENNKTTDKEPISEKTPVTDTMEKEDNETQENKVGLKDKIKSKIQINKINLGVLSTETKYDYYENEIDCEDFYSLPETDVMGVVEDVIKTEAPVHRQEVYNRLKKVYNVKATKKFKTHVDSIISILLQSSNEIYVKNNYYHVFQKETVVRKRIKPNIDYISDDEIIEAINQVLILNNSVKRNELKKQVSKLLGFKSLSSKTSNRLEEVISFLRFSDKLSIDSNEVVILNDTK